MNKFEEGSQAYKKAIEVNPKNAHAYYNLGYIYHKQYEYTYIHTPYDIFIYTKSKLYI